MLNLSKEQWLGILRHIIGGVGPLLVLKGLADEQTVALVGGMILSIGAIVASVKAPEKSDAARGKL